MAETDPCSLLTLPSEVFHHLVSFLDVLDIISLRKTCTVLSHLTHDRSLWFDLLRWQQRFLPLPAGARTHDSLLEFTSSELETIVTTAYTVNRNWLSPRLNQAETYTTDLGSFILALELFLDQWLVCVYSEGVVAMWDLGRSGLEGDSRSPGLLCACIRLQGSRPWTSSVACLDSENAAIIVAVTRTEGPSTTCLFRIPLSTESDSGSEYEDLATILSSSAQIVRAINPELRLIAFSRSCFVDVVDWLSQECSSLSTQSEDLDELWNGIVGLRFCANHLLCIKTRSVEIFPLPPLPITSSSQPPHLQNPEITRLLSYTFPNTTFRGVSISHPQTYHATGDETDDTIYDVSFLAYDVLRGLFHYRIRIQIPSPDASHPPLLSIVLAGAHCMTSLVTSSPSMPALIDEVTGRTARGFVSACCLGPEGTRGLWIERTRGSIRRMVVVFSADVSSAEEDDYWRQTIVGAEDASPSVVEGTVEGRLDGRPIYEIGSYDLRDDLTHCTFSEVTGQIVLGTRSGQIQVL